MDKGDKVFSITYVVAYALTNSHHSIDYKQKDFIELDDIFSEIGSTVPKQFVEIKNNNESWAIDISKDKSLIGYNPKRTIRGNNLEIGESSRSFIPRTTSLRFTDGSENRLLAEISKKMDNLTQKLDYNS